MRLKEMFKKTSEQTEKSTRGAAPEGIIQKCSKCGSLVFTEELSNNLDICPKCGAYQRMHARKRIDSVVDTGSFEEWDMDLISKNPLEYKGYEERIADLQLKTGLDEAVITGRGQIHGMDVVIGAMDCRFLMASMGWVVGEKITRAVERATDMGLSVILFTCSGGARMQEGMSSLMQMAKTSAALKRHSDAGHLYISILTDPTTGGVTASFAMLGDIILAEPKALVGFAGPRVIEQTIGQKLPKGFQRSEFLVEHGLIDAIVTRKNVRRALTRLLYLHQKDAKIAFSVSEPAEKMVISEKIKKNRTPWERVELSRRADRPVGEDYVYGLVQDFVQLHGDRHGTDDQGILGGIGTFHGVPVTIIAQSKGHNLKENVARNFGMPSPEGYRKALRLMKQAEKFHRPIILFVDTPGAFCGMEAEEDGQGEAIARNLFEMSNLSVPVLSVVIGEGGSGGALAMAVADEVWMLENAVYSILSPEGYASILWKDSKKAKDAARIMKMTAMDLKKMNIIEKVFTEPEEYTMDNLPEVLEKLTIAIYAFLEEKSQLSTEQLISQRYNRFRKM